MSYWLKLFVVALLALSLQVQSFAAASIKCVIADDGVDETPLAYVEHDIAQPYYALQEVAAADDIVQHHHRDSCHGHACSSCACGCCLGIPLPVVSTISLTPDAARVIAPLPPSAGAVSFLTGGIERPPRHTLL